MGVVNLGRICFAYTLALMTFISLCSKMIALQPKLSINLEELAIKKKLYTSGVLEHKWRASLKLHYC